MKIGKHTKELIKKKLFKSALIKALGMSSGTSAGKGDDRITSFITQSRFNDFITNELEAMSKNPISFKMPGGSMAFGYEATILVDICDMVIQAKKHDKLLKQQYLNLILC